MRLTRPIVFMCFLIAVTAGCSNFEHSLPWSQSPLHEELQGSWQSIKGAEDPLKMDIFLNKEGSLSVDISVDGSVESGNSDSSLPFAEKTRKVVFSGDVVVANGVDVLQIDMKSYEETDGAEKKTGNASKKGFQFLQVLSEGDSMLFRRLDIEQFARYAEEELLKQGTTLTASKFADCIEREISSGLVLGALYDLLQERPTDLLTEDEIKELEQGLEEFKTREVEPYKELQQMRECIAHKLPGDMLGRLFISNPDLSFSGEIIRLVKVK